MADMDRPRDLTVRQLYALSMNRCAFPDCATELVTPGTGTVVGEVCHIRARSPAGPRYSADQTDEERHGFDNLILMCRNHHKQIDATAGLHRYTVDWLLAAKRTHEEAARASGRIGAPSDIVTALALTTIEYGSGSTHMDFRNAVFKVGGEGGGPLGGGGQGGALTIVGISRLPDAVAADIEVDLAGGHGTYPGGGGGGGGVLIFEGRDTTPDDVTSGLKVPLFFPANSATVADALLYVLGAGWECCWVPGLPSPLGANIAFVVEFGSLAADSLLKFEVVMVDPGGLVHVLETRDLPVPVPVGSINRCVYSSAVQLSFHSAGIHSFELRSGNRKFASYPFDVRIGRPPHS